MEGSQQANQTSKKKTNLNCEVLDDAHKYQQRTTTCSNTFNKIKSFLPISFVDRVPNPRLREGLSDLEWNFRGEGT